MTNMFRDALAKVGIRNGLDLAERVECPAVILFFAGPRVAVPYAELRVWDKGREHVFAFRPRHPTTMSVSAMRRKTTEEAMAYASADPDLADLGEWGGTPFSNCWMPKQYLQQARERYLETSTQG